MASTRFDRLPYRLVYDRAVPIATGLRARTLGLSHLDREDAGPGLLIPRCASVHTFGMRFALDVHFLDADGELLSSRLAVAARRFVAHRGAAAVLETPASGTDCPISRSFRARQGGENGPPGPL